MSTIVESGRYILTSLQSNNNKWWEIVRFDDHRCETHFGRVGDAGQRNTKQFGSEQEAIKFYNQICKEKSRKGYQPVQTLEGSSATQKVVGKEDVKALALQQIQFTSPLVRDLVTYLSERNVHSILEQTTMTFDASRGTFSTPLGIVTDQAIQNARHMLTQIANRVAGSQWSDPQLTPLVNSYLMLIPQNIGRRRQEARDLFPDLTAIQRQNALLDGLEASLQAVLAAPAGEPTRTSAPVFNVKLEYVEDGKEIDRIRKKFRSTAQAMHESRHLDVKTVYLVEIEHMRKAFEQDGAKMQNIWEMWHGSRASNVLSILKSGFTVPPAQSKHCTGRLYGDGIYHSDQSTKALNYAFGYWDGGTRDNLAYMFLNNVAMGNYYTPAGTGERLPKPGYDSTFAVGGKSGVLNNEMIVYKTSRLDSVFLVAFSPGGK